MTVITGNIQDIGYQPLSGTLTATSVDFRDAGGTLVAPESRSWPIVAGAVSATLLPGPARLTISAGSHARDEWDVIVPDADIELATLISDSIEWAPPIMSIVGEHRRAAEAAADRAETAAEAAEGSAAAAAVSSTAAAGSASAAAGSATAAAGSASNAAESATAAATSASAAFSSATTASGHVTTATTQAGIATGAATSASGSASTAAGHADAAAGSAAAASGSETSAGSKATAAAGSATAAEQYAQQVVDALANAQAYQDVLTAIGDMSADWQGDIAAAIADLVGQAPETLDSIHEMAAALGNDPNFYTTMMTALGERVKIDDPRLTDARTPTTHTHPLSQVVGLVGALGDKSDVGHTHAKAQVGLANVDNTSDASKPVSTAVQAALSPLQARVGAAPATWMWAGTTLPIAASQVDAQARAGDFIIAPNLTTDPGWHQITGV